MESDSVRSSGEFTVVDMWVEGKLRCISVSREAIDASLQLSPQGAAALSDDERRDFVRNNLSLVVAAAKERVKSNPAADSVTIEAGDLGGARAAPKGGDRRRGGDRRKGDRRKVAQPVARERRSGRDRRTS